MIPPLQVPPPPPTPVAQVSLARSKAPPAPTKLATVGRDAGARAQDRFEKSRVARLRNLPQLAALDAAGPSPGAWAGTVGKALDQYTARKSRLAELLAAAAQDPAHPPVIADPQPPAPDPRLLKFDRLAESPRFVFFNHRESFYPYQLGRDWREIQRSEHGLALDAGAPRRFTIAASHANEGGHPASVGLRLSNRGAERLVLEIGGFRYRDETYGTWAKRELIDRRLESGGSFRVVLDPGETADLPVLRIGDGGVGSYQIEAERTSGKAEDLVIREIGRFDGAPHPAAEVRDPWDHPLLGGMVPRIPIYLDKGGRVGLPSVFKTHQEFVGQTVVSEPRALRPGDALRIAGYQFGTPSPDDFPLRDRGYGFHVDHVARFTLPAGKPRAFRLTAYGGGVAPQLDQLPLTGPDGKRVVLGGQQGSVDIPFDHLATHPAGRPWLRVKGSGADAVYELAVSFPNGSSTYLQIEPLYP